MPKNNYEKVDAAMDSGLLEIKAKQWLKESELKSKLKEAPENLRSARERLAEVAEERRKERRLTIAATQFEVDRLFIKNRHLYTTLGTYHDEFTDLLAHAELDDDKWKRLLEIRDKLMAYKKELDKKLVSDDKIVESERKKHINKRHNVKDGWLPLH